MKNSRLELKDQFKEYLQLSKSHLEIKLDPEIEYIIEDVKVKNGEISKLKKSTEVYYENEKKLKVKDESNKENEKINIKKIRKVSLKTENKDIENFSSETKIKYLLEKIENIYLKKEENIKLKEELILIKENLINISNHKSNSTERNNNISKNHMLILFFCIFSSYISSFHLEKRREETYNSRGSAANKSIQL